MTVSALITRNDITATASQTSFTYTFRVLAATDMDVYQNGVLLSSGYTVNNVGTTTGGTVVLDAGVPVGQIVSLVLAMPLDRTTDYQNSGKFLADDVNSDFDKGYIGAIQNENAISRSLRLKDVEPTIDMTLPLKNARKGAVLGFDENTGLPVAGPNIADVSSVAAITADITTVAGISSEVSAVAAISANVTTVAGSADNINTVASNNANINTVASNDANITTVATNIGDVTNFADVYQGGKASDPAVRNDGSALQTGDLYFNTVTNELRAYSGSSWTFGAAGSVSVTRFSGTGAQTAYTLPTAPSSENNTQVYIDGVYQQKDTYSVSGVTLTFSEAPPLDTDNIEVTTIESLALGATSSDLVSHIASGTGAVATTVQDKLRESVSVKDFGATGDGVTDDTAAIQAAIDSIPNGGSVLFSAGTYKVSRTVGANDSWGIKVPQSNVTLIGRDAYLTRFDTDISTYALSYPILFVGTPDSDVASATNNFTVDGIKFIGESVQHSTSGSSLSDKRNCIEFKNTYGTLVLNCQFTEIDSAAIFYQYPALYDYVHSAYYNLTKNYNSKIEGCNFYASPHSVVGRALIHAIGCTGVDRISVNGNSFEWCDVILDGEGTYSSLDQLETDTWTPAYSGWALGAVKRSGRDWSFTNNIAIDSSEHAVYAAAMNLVVTGNIFRVESKSICIGDLKVRSAQGNISGNSIISGVGGSAISITAPSYLINVTGNSIYTTDESGTAGAININSDGLSSYINARLWLTDYQAMENINISGNNIMLPTAAGTGVTQVGIRLVTSNSVDANYPEGTVRNLTVSGNSIKNPRHATYVVGQQAKNIVIEGNTFDGKPYVSSGFAPATTVNTYSTLLVDSASTSALQSVVFRNNTVTGSEYLFATDDGAGTAVDIPWGITCNFLYAIKNFKTSDMRTPDVYNIFRDNNGYHFLDRTGWLGQYSLGNSLGTSASSATERTYNFAYTGTAVRFYTDDTGSFITL